MRTFALRLESLLGLVARLFFGLAGTALAAIVGLILASVIMRRVVNAPLFYTEELVGLLLSASLFLALPMVTVQAQHVRVTFLVQALPAAGRTLLAWLAGAVTLGFCGWFLIEALPWLQFAVERRIKTDAASLLLAPWMAVPPLSIALSALLAVTRLLTGSEQAAFSESHQSE